MLSIIHLSLNIVFINSGLLIDHSMQDYQFAALAQLAEHPLSKRKVVGSNPTGGCLFLNRLSNNFNFIFNYNISEKKLIIIL